MKGHLSLGHAVALGCETLALKSRGLNPTENDPVLGSQLDCSILDLLPIHTARIHALENPGSIPSPISTLVSEGPAGEGKLIKRNGWMC